MRSPFASPALNYLPKEMQSAYEAAALAAALDNATSEVYSDALSLRDRYSAESCPTGSLDELGAMLGVSFKQTDTDRQKRAKIASAVRSQKYNGTWPYSAKLAIDAVTGFSSSIWSSPQSDWPVRIGDASSYNSGLHWMIRGSNATDEAIIRTGFGSESIIAGNIYIDVGTNTLTAELVALTVAAIIDIVPAYERILLGYTTAGAFTVYAGGQIG